MHILHEIAINTSIDTVLHINLRTILSAVRHNNGQVSSQKLYFRTRKTKYTTAHIAKRISAMPT
jgi:hypothetical protein